MSSTTDVSQINHPIVKIAKAINAAMNQIPANADLTAMPYIGLPYPQVGFTLGNSAIYDTSATLALTRIAFDSNGVLQTNYCYLSAPPPNDSISCVFGPS